MQEQHTYTIAIYNKLVRSAIEDGESHKQLDDEWADLHYIEIDARDETQAKNRISSRYPKRQGYVIAEIIAEKEFS